MHDFTSGVISIRARGASLPEIVGKELGTGVRHVIRIFSVLLLILVGAVFVITPASLIGGMTLEWMDQWFWVGVIFLYYMMATVLPIDKLIGNLYPIFGIALLFMATGLLAVMLFSSDVTLSLDFAGGLSSRVSDPQSHPVFPMMFVSIACGAISGFHATQSPMMARCLTNEKLAKPIFYGAMVAEGIVALIWAAAAIAFTGGYERLAEYFATHTGGAGTLVTDISMTWLGAIGGILAIIGVVAAPITSGDTALRSARLIVADMLHIGQAKAWKRLLISIPIFALVSVLLLIDFTVLWRYFAWSNQTLAVFTLWAATVYLARHRKAYMITLAPAVFMAVVCVSYILFAPCTEGFGLSADLSLGTGIATAIVFICLFSGHIRRLSSQSINLKTDY